MTEYGLEYLKSRGSFINPVSEKLQIDDEEVEYIFDDENRLAYFTSFPKDKIVQIVRKMRIETVLDLYWFWHNERLYVYRNAGENKQFIFNTKQKRSSEFTRGKIRKLEQFSSTNVGILFETSEVVDRFYKQMWIIRLELAKSIISPISDQDKLLMAQRVIDRLIFMYFLVEKGIIQLQYCPSRARTLFGSLVDEKNFYQILCIMSFEKLNQENSTPLEYPNHPSQQIIIPYLNGVLFKEVKIPTETGSINESNVDIQGFDWRKLVNELNRYNWLIDDYTSEEPEEPDIIGNLTPEILGHIYERFVISISELDKIDLNELNTDKKGQLRYGRKKVGAFYTPSPIAQDLAMQSLKAFLNEKWNKDENSKNLADLVYKLDEKEKKITLSFLSQIRVLDPSVGSGAFLLAFADALLRAHRLCGDEKEEYILREEIIINNLFGVDLLQGATEICMLRLWLWLAAAYEQGEPVKPLPNIEFNIRSGNSLLGIVSEDFDVGGQEVFVGPDLAESIKLYQMKLKKYTRDGEQNKDLLLSLHKDNRKKFHEIFAGVLNIEFKRDIFSVDELDKELKSVERGSAKLRIYGYKFSDEERKSLEYYQFSLQTKSAWKKISLANKSQVNNTLDVAESFLLKGAKISLERPVSPDDVAKQSAFHWLMEFPHIYTTGQRFDIVLGNPPHGSKLNKNEKRIYDELYDLSEGRQDIAKYFTERAYYLADSVLTFVLPKSSTYTTKWIDFREFIKPRLTRAVDMGVAFSGVKHEQFTFQIEKSCSKKVYGTARLFNNEIIPVSVISKEYDDKALHVNITDEEMGVLNQILSNTEYLFKDLNLRVFRGEVTKKASKGILCIKGNEIKRFGLHKCVHKIKSKHIRPGYLELYKKPKVIAQNIVAHVTKPKGHLKITAVYDDKHPNFETVINIVPNQEDGSKLAKVLVALLNSPVVNFFVYLKLYNRAVRDIHFDNYYIERIPYPSLSENEMDLVEYLSEICSNLVSKGNKALYKDSKKLLDVLIYELYLTKQSTRKLSKSLIELKKSAESGSREANELIEIDELIKNPIIRDLMEKILNDKMVKLIERSVKR